MLGYFSKYASVKVTPSSTAKLSVENPLGVVPKYVHVTSEHDAAPYTAKGYARECWLADFRGSLYATNGSTGEDMTNIMSPVQQAPTAVQTYYFGADTVEIYKGTGSVSGRWHTSTEYTVHIYA